MYGYQEDRVNVDKGRKETFKNTTEDAFHAAFATTCNFYIVNDEKGYKKSKKVYEKLNINTYSVKPFEFVEYFKKYLVFEEKIWNFTIIPGIVENFPFDENRYEGRLIRSYYVPYYLFDFFNKVIVMINDNEPLQVVLSRVNPTNGGKYVFEIITLAGEICSLLGQDADGLGEVKASEFEESEWIGRKWNVGDKVYRLVSINGYIQFYL